jgi:hypothetical protein
MHCGRDGSTRRSSGTWWGWWSAIRTEVKTDVTAADAILRRATANRRILIVMGVNRRPGDALFFGNVAAAVLEKSRRSILFVSGPGSRGTVQPSAGNKARHAVAPQPVT